MTTAINVLQLICPSGFYGAERWILALANNADPKEFVCDLAVTVETGDEKLELVEKYRELGLKAFEVPMKHRFDLSVVDGLCELIEKRNIDIIHTHGYKSDILGVLAARRAGIKSVCTPHGFENSTDLKLRLFIWLGCQSMRFFDAVAPLSQQLCNDVKPYGVKPEKLHYIQNGVDLSEVDKVRNCDPSGSIIRDNNPKRIGFIGQMISRKNIVELLDIFNELHSKHSNLELILLGDGEERQSLEKYAAGLPSAEAIKFLGFRDDRLELLKSFDLFVMTSSLEGIPRCLMESMAMGIPVAAYDIAGIDQLLQHEYSGLLAPFGDKSTLAQYWEEILFNDTVSRKLSDNALEYVNEHFSANRMAKEYARLFQQQI